MRQMLEMVTERKGDGTQGAGCGISCGGEDRYGIQDREADDMSANMSVRSSVSLLLPIPVSLLRS